MRKVMAVVGTRPDLFPRLRAGTKAKVQIGKLNEPTR
jgi:hypothetical protein